MLRALSSLQDAVELCRNDPNTEIKPWAEDEAGPVRHVYLTYPV